MLTEKILNVYLHISQMSPDEKTIEIVFSDNVKEVI